MKNNPKEKFDKVSETTYIQEKLIPEDEIELINTILDSFILPSESIKKENEIDIKLALKSLPSVVDKHNCHRCESMNFSNTQKALIAYQNDDTDELFKFYDDRNKKRLYKLSKKASITKQLTADLMRMGNKVYDLLVAHKGIGPLSGAHQKKVDEQHSGVAKGKAGGGGHGHGHKR